MYQTSKNSIKEYSDTVMEFGGLNLRARGNVYEFFDMMNMSSREYPLLSPRKRRCTVYSTENNITSLYNKEALLWTENDGIYHRLFINANENEYFRTTENIGKKRRIVGMGAYAVVFPDNKYINLLDYEDKGKLGNKYTYETGADYANGLVERCTLDGTVISPVASSSEPSSPSNGQIWIDTSGDKSVEKKWDESTKQWVQVSTTYFRITAPGIENGFSKWDTVKISGLRSDVGMGHTERAVKQVEGLNAESAIIYNVVENGLVFAGILDEACIIVTKGKELTIERVVPEMDFVVECNNRLWGCKYGVVNGKVVNEIYACRQGDFKNWYAYLGISTDSYAVTVGSEGAFTGAAVYNKCPVFFKEDCIHMIYGSTPSSYQVVTINGEGIEKGQGESVCTADNILYYKGPTGFFAFSGSLPQKISRALGEHNFGNVVGAGVGDKVYFACGAEDEQKDIFVYDTYYRLWHKEDKRNIRAFSRDGHLLYMLTRENGRSAIESVTDECDIEMLIDKENFPELEDEVQWSAESVDIGYSDVNMKYIKKFTIRAQMSENTKLRVLLSCDGEAFKQVGYELNGSGVHTCSISFTPQRCEYFRYRIEGIGDARIVSVKKTMVQGSDKP